MIFKKKKKKTNCLYLVKGHGKTKNKHGFKKKKKKKRLMLHAQTILQYFYKLLIWQNLSGLHLGLSLTSHFYLSIITNHINSL